LFSLSFNPDLLAEFIPKTWHIWDKWRIVFNFIFTLYPYWIFVKRDKLLSKTIKFKYENINLKKCPAEVFLTSKLYDKIIKMSSKSHETIPLRTNNGIRLLKKRRPKISSHWPFNVNEQCFIKGITSQYYSIVKKIGRTYLNTKTQ
jgi:hypothetical protein